MKSEESNKKSLTDIDRPNFEERVRAINSLSRSDLRDKKVLEKLRIIALGDPDSSVRKTARRVIGYYPDRYFSFDLNAEFWFTFVFWFLLNISLVLLIPSLLSSLTMLWLPFLINIIVIAVFAYINPNISLGMIVGLVGAIMLGPYIIVFYFIYWILSGGAG